MVTRSLLAGVLASACMGAVGSAQTSSSASTPAEHAAHAGHAVEPNTSTPDMGASNESGVLTFAGCLMRHRDLPATHHAAPDARMKHEGYILVDATIVVHHRSSGGMMSPIATSGTHDHAATAAGGSSSPAGAARFTADNIGESQMFKIEGLSEAELRALTGRLVNVIGRLDLGAFADSVRLNAPMPQDLDHDAAPLNATSIHAVTGSCRH